MSERTLYQEATVGGIQMSVVPVEPDLSALEKRLSQRLFQRSPASLNATDRSLLHAAVYEDVVGALGIGGNE